jgi:prevent-host-death family protein
MVTIPLTLAKARLSELVERLIIKKEHIVITKHGKPAAALMPYDEWKHQQAGAAGGLADAAGPGQDLDTEIDQMIEEIYESRKKSRARIFGRLKADLERRGLTRFEPDLQIASIALAHNLILVTGNVRHYDGIPGLRVENWLA